MSTGLRRTSHTVVLVSGISVLLTCTLLMIACGGGSSAAASQPVWIAVSPGVVASLNIGATQQFSATVTGNTNTAVTWAVSCSGSNCGTISASGLYTAPATINAADTVTVKATSSADATKSATATVNLVPVVISVAPGSASLNIGGTQQFSATVTGNTNTSVTWTISCSGSNCGAVSAGGLYTAPASIASAMAVTVKATSSADASKSATATVNLVPVAVSVAPGSASLNIGGTQQFTATVTGSSNTAVTWAVSCSGSNCGAVSAGGLYTAPTVIDDDDPVTVKAASSADSTKSATATVNLVPVRVSVAPGTATLNAGGTQQFTATVTGSTNSATSGGPYTVIATNVTGTLYDDATVVNGTPYYYAVTASNSAGESLVSNEASATPAAASGFAVSATADSTSLVPGHSLTYTVTVTPAGGFTGAIALSASSLPPGATAAFSPASVTISDSTPVTSTLTVTTTANVPTGNSAFAIIGTSGAIQASTPAAFSVAWTLSWSDEFNGSAGTQPDTNRWSYDLGGGGWGNSELECYTNSPNNIATDGNGNLVITGIYTPAGFTCPGSSGTYYYSSARIKTAYLGPYGRYEARIKVPYGKGVFPAFWMLGNGTNCTAPLGSWPSCGEIDIMENFSQEPAIVHSTLQRTYANGTSTGSNSNGCSAAVSNGTGFADDFHTFAIEWAKDSITFYVDDNRCGTTFTPATNTAAAWPFNDHPFNVLLNFAVGGIAVTAPDATTVWRRRCRLTTSASLTLLHD